MSKRKNRYYVLCANSEQFRAFIARATREVEDFDKGLCVRLSEPRDFYGVNFSAMHNKLAVVQNWNAGARIEFEEEGHEAMLNYKLHHNFDAIIYDL